MFHVHLWAGYSSILLDYGRELHGGLKLVLGAARPWGTQLVRVRFGESVSEACSEHDGGRRRKGYSTNDHAMRDITMKVPSDGQIEIGNTGFRFVRIDLLGSDAVIRLKEAPASCVTGIFLIWVLSVAVIRG